MTLHEALESLIAGQDLSAAQTQAVMNEIMGGEATPAQVAGFLIALRMKGETATEIAAAAKVMREKSLRVPVRSDLRDRLVDTCGTGGDGAGLFNVSTASALLLAAMGVPVAKHGNRSVSSSTGSADVLLEAGIPLENPPEVAAKLLEDKGFAFLFAPIYHPAMKHAIGPRRELKTRTVFNLLGPLTNPAGARRQVLGVFSSSWLRPMAEVLKKLGSQHVLVVHSDDGLDEFSVSATTQVCEMQGGEMREYRVEPEQFGLRRYSLDDLTVSSAAESWAMIQQAFAGEVGPPSAAIALNAGAGLYVGGVEPSLEAGVQAARKALKEGVTAPFLESLNTAI